MARRRRKKPQKPGVYVVRTRSKCRSCGAKVSSGDFMDVAPGNGRRCLRCAGLEQLEFLPSGDTAMTVRARKHSTIDAIVYKRIRRRTIRVGVLVEPAAIERARRQCDADAGARARNRAQAAVRRARDDEAYVERFAAAIRRAYPATPKAREHAIARHACEKHSGRVGRSAAAKEFARQMIDLAVRAHVRHVETDYEALLSAGVPRPRARDRVEPDIAAVMNKWRGQ